MQEVTHHTPDTQRRYNQNDRLIKEFPWLWGIRQEWRLLYDKVSATKADEELTNFLYDKKPDPKIEVWAYIQQSHMRVAVKRIKYRTSCPQYGVLLRSCYSHPQFLRYVILVQNTKDESNATPVNCTTVRIYRPPYREVLMDTFIRTRAGT